MAATEPMPLALPDPSVRVLLLRSTFWPMIEIKPLPAEVEVVTVPMVPPEPDTTTVELLPTAPVPPGIAILVALTISSEPHVMVPGL